MQTQTTPKNSFAIKDCLFLALGCLAFFIASGIARPLWNPDETRYCLIPFTMVQSGDWTVPMLQWVPYFEKPVFSYWLNALSFKVFGLGLLQAKLSVILSGVAGVVMTYLMGLKMFDRKTALYASVITATSIEYTALSTIITTDIVFSACLIGAWLSFWNMHTALRGGGNAAKATVAFWTLASLAFLTKGPLGLILPGISVFLFCLLLLDFSIVKKFRYITGAVIFAIINLPWNIAVFMRDPRHLNFFYIRENFQAFFEGSIHHPGSKFYYLATVAGGFFPWSILAFIAVGVYFWRIIKRRENREAMLFVMATIVSVLGFFTAASVKLHTYLLPIFPFFALVISRFWIESEEAQKTKALKTGIIVPFALLATALAVVVLLPSLGRGDDYVSAKEAFCAVEDRMLTIIDVLFFIGGLALGAFAAFKKKFRTAFIAMALTMVLVFPLTMYLAGRKVKTKTCQTIIRALPEGTFGQDDMIVSTDETDYSIPFLLKRRTVILGSAGELGYGYYVQTHDDGAMPDFNPYDVCWLNAKSPYLKSYEDIKELWDKDRRIWLFIKRSHLKYLHRLEFTNLIEAGSTKRTVLYTNKPLPAAS